MKQQCLVILTGEYPPEPGGVSDHTRLLAESLALGGFSPVVACGGFLGHSRESGVDVHRVGGGFAPSHLSALGRVLGGCFGRRVLLIQYAPHALGLRGMNVPLALWLAWRAWFHGDRVVACFHEVAFPFRGPWRHRFLAMAQRLMAAIVAASSTVVLATTDAWIPVLKALGVRRGATRRLPVFSNLPEEVDPRASESRRERWLRDTGAERLVAHFGTFGGGVAELLRGTLAAFPHDSRTAFLLLGREAVAWLASHATQPWANRCRVVPDTDARSLAETIAGCDAALQPYPDGVTTRRTTVMSALALGVPVVSNLGPLSDRCWQGGKPIALLAPNPNTDQLACLLEELLDRPPADRARLGQCGREWYGISASRAAAARAVAAIMAELT